MEEVDTSHNYDIFLSYSWKDKEYADQIDNHFQALGIRFKRDVRDVKYKSSIKDFMKRIRDSDFVIMLISQEFLRSPSCMYEVMELIKDESFSKRLLQIVLDNARIFDPEYSLNTIRYWQEKKSLLTQESSDIDLKSLAEISNTIKQYDNISANAGFFLDYLKNHNSKAFSDLKSNSYADILDYIGYLDDDVIQELNRISDISDPDDKAIAIDEFIIRNPEEPVGYAFKGREQNSPKRELFYYDKAISLLSTEDVNLFFNRAAAKYDLRDFNGALEDYNKAISLEDEGADIYCNRAKTKMKLGYKNLAILDFDKAIALERFNDTFYLERAIAKAECSNLEGSLRDLDKAISLNPKKASLLVNRGIIKNKFGLQDEALEDFNLAISLNPKEISALILKFSITTDMKDSNGQLESINRIIQLDPSLESLYPQITPAYIYFYRAMAKYDLGDEVGYKKDIEYSLLLSSEKPTFYTVIGIQIYELGDLGLAETILDEALRLRSNNSDAYYYKGQIHRKRGNEVQAVNDINRAIELGFKEELS